MTKPSPLTWHIFAGLIIGAVLIPIVGREWGDWREEAARVRQIATPVVRVNAEVVAQDGSSITLRLIGEKLRQCDFVALQAFTVSAAGVMTMAQIAQADEVKGPLATRPVGRFDAGSWRIWPLDRNAFSVRVYVIHMCDGVDVRSVVAQVAINGNG